MVDMGVGEHDAVQPPRVERQPRVELVRPRAVALEQPRVQQESATRGLEQMHGAGDLSRRAPEGQTNAAHVPVRYRG